VATPLERRFKPFQKAKDDFVNAYFVGLLVTTKGRTNEAARMAGMTPPNFCKWLRNLGLKAENFR
jgi:DNA-binding NtrC family response regulator